MESEKKSLIAHERDEGKRAAFRLARQGWDRGWLVFVDESGCQTTMTPRYARAPKGKRAYGRVPRNQGTNITLIAALSQAGMGAAMTLEGAADTEAFVAYLTHQLVPSLVPGQVVVLDNLSVHKNAAVRRLVEGAGCGLAYLPPYSPDYMPIEGAFSKLKQYLRTIEARTREGVEKAIGVALDTITAGDAAGWFTACGYPPNPAQPL